MRARRRVIPRAARNEADRIELLYDRANRSGQLDPAALELRVRQLERIYGRLSSSSVPPAAA